MPDFTFESIQSLASIGNIVLAMIAILVAICVVTIRWKDIFRSDLRKRQLEELVSIRRELHDVWAELHYLPATRDMMENSSWNFPRPPGSSTGPVGGLHALLLLFT